MVCSWTDTSRTGFPGRFAHQDQHTSGIKHSSPPTSPWDSQHNSPTTLTTSYIPWEAPLQPQQSGPQLRYLSAVGEERAWFEINITKAFWLSLPVWNNLISQQVFKLQDDNKSITSRLILGTTVNCNFLVLLIINSNTKMLQSTRAPVL